MKFYVWEVKVTIKKSRIVTHRNYPGFQLG